MIIPGGKRRSRPSLPAALALAAVLAVASCVSSAPPAEAPLGASPSAGVQEPRPAGIADEIRNLVEIGTPPSLIRALDIIRSRDLGQTDFGRVMNGTASTLLRRLYPEISVEFPPFDLPQSHPYARILRDAERGAYTPAAPSSGDFLELVLPFLAFMGETRSERLSSALPDLERAAAMNRRSVLAPYFIGLAAERSGRIQDAHAAYSTAFALSRDSYPAVLGLSRIAVASGRPEEAIRLLQDLLPQYPDNLGIKRELAVAYYRNGDWSRAEPAVAELLQRDARDGRFIIMRAHILVEQGHFLQAQPLLDVYASIDAGSRLYLFLRARVQAEGYRNRDSALTYLRSLLRSSPSDSDAAAYAARLLMESGRPEDRQEGRALLRSLLSAERPAAVVLELAVRDAVARSSWAEALPFMERLLLERRSSPDLLNAYQIQRGLRNSDSALAFAQELYERDPLAEEGVSAYIGALIGSGRREEAARLIDGRLASLSGGVVKSRYFFLRSRLKTDEEGVLNDLRSSLFEDPRNLDALIAMLEIYHRRRDERRAVYYLKQALALAPDNPLLKRYQIDYASALNS